MKWNQARALLQWVKGAKAVILKDENERFITGNVGNNNTANGPLAIVSILGFEWKNTFSYQRICGYKCSSICCIDL